MEALEDKIKKFLAVNSGDGYGYGYGDGYGSGDGYGDGDGSGYSSGVKEFEGCKVWHIDGVQTLLYSVHSNYAKGAILQSDLTLTPCFIAKADDYFAHGDTLRSAMNDATAKAMQNMPLEKRIERFVTGHDKDKKFPIKDLFDWHNILTGSCRAGREAFCRDKGIDIESGEYSVSEFIKITEHSYGGEIIKKLKPYYAKNIH